MILKNSLNRKNVLMIYNFEENRIFITDDTNKTIAEVTFPAICGNVNTVNIDHTFVDDLFRGQGIADKLMTAATEKLREGGKKACATCSYAIKWFEKHPEYGDVYNDDNQL